MSVDPGLSWTTLEASPITQHRARVRAEMQMEKALWRLADSNRLDALAAIEIVKRASRAERNDPQAAPHRCGESCQWAAGE